MCSMKLKYENGDKVSDSINLLVSILVRYPEVGTINFDPESKVIKFSFMLPEVIDDGRVARLTEVVSECVHTFCWFKDITIKSLDIKCWKHEKVTILEIKRDIGSLTQDEISLIISLLHQEFPDLLVADANEPLLEEELDYQEQLIGDILDNISQDFSSKRLYAYRDEGKVMVFNK